MQQILLLTDFSKNASNAISYAMQLFSGETIKFYVLNVQKVSRYITSNLLTSPNHSIYDAVIRDPKKALVDLIENLKKKHNNENYIFEEICDYDSLVSSIKQLIKIKNIDMLVMGTNGASGIKETVFGSNTIRVIRKIDLPILVIPEDYAFVKPLHVLFINETKAAITQGSLKPLKYIQSKFDATLSVLTFASGGDDNEYKNQKEELNLFFKDVNVNFYTDGNWTAENTLDTFMVNNKIELASKIINRQRFFKNIFPVQIATDIVYAKKVSILFL